MRFGFERQISTRSFLQIDVNLLGKSKQSSYMNICGRIIYVFAWRNSSKRRDQPVLLWSSAVKRRAGCAPLRVGPKPPSQGWLPLVWRQRDVPSALESTCLRVLCFTIWLAAAAGVQQKSVVYEYVSTERLAPSVFLLVSRPDLGPTDCSLAKERRAARRPCVGRETTSEYVELCHHPTHWSFCCCLLSCVFYIISNFESLPYFDL